jgi:hypothetical protein
MNQEQGLPFSTSWIRAAQVTAGTHKNVMDRSEAVIRFDGKLSEYEPGQDLLDAFLDLQLSDSPGAKPPKEFIAFFQQYGPLGLFYSEMPTYMAAKWETEMIDEIFETGDTSLDNYMRRYLSRKLPAHMKATPTLLEVLSHGYFERWSSIYSRLAELQQIAGSMIDNADLSIINASLRSTSLIPALRNTNGHVEWSFAFRSLGDAIIGLMVQRVIGGSVFATCEPCGRLFTSTGRKYHSDACMIEAQEMKRRGDSFLKEKRRLRELLRTRVEKHGLPAATKEEIKLAVNAAPDTAALDAVKEQYQDVFARHRGSVHSEQGRQGDEQ